MIRVEIIKVTEHAATVEVYTEDGAQRFNVSSGTEAYNMFKLAVHNAAMTIAKRKADALMREIVQ